MPETFSFNLIVCVHRLRNVRTGFVDALSKSISVSVHEPMDKDPLENGKVYISPANYHLLVEPGEYITLSTFRRVNHSRPSIDLTMKSAAEAYGHACTGILLSGANTDGVDGMMAIRQKGGTTIVQDPLEAEIPAMPEAALHSFVPDYILTADKIITFIKNMCAVS